ncbi:MAG TPA: hypothetical protein DCQ06_05380 [Myxococcales bacterium]|nr:hypothetical protein [Myxococcales bacterium]
MFGLVLIDRGFVVLDEPSALSHSRAMNRISDRPEHQFRKNMRSRLLMLVALPLLVTIASVVGLERVLERQLINDAMRHVMETRDVLQSELDEHVRTLKVEILGLAQSSILKEALQKGDMQALQSVLKAFSESYPEIDLIIANRDGKVLSSNHKLELKAVSDLETLHVPNLSGEVTNALSMHGCERAKGQPMVNSDVREATQPPARVLAARVGEGAIVIACERLDRDFLERVGKPLQMKLALVDEAHEHLLLAHSQDFPVHVRGRREESLLSEADGDLWAVAEFCPRLFTDTKDDCVIDAISAMSVLKLRNTVRKDFLLLLLPLLLVGGFALLWGGRLAYTLNETLDRLLAGFRRLETHNFEPIEPMRTGNELEEIGHGFNHAVEGLKERNHLRTTFGKYMTESVAAHLLSNQVKLGGDSLQVTVLFSDIRGFTSMSEKMDAQQVVSRLNEYFTRMVDVVMEHGGVVDKYIGDALMVIFGAPVPSGDDALNAVKAAVDMRKALAELNAELIERGELPIRTGIGLHTGEVVAGNIGSERRMEYTVIGDAVNLASRLEGCTKELGSDLVISESTYRAVQAHVQARLIDTIQVKGRDQAVRVYALDSVDSSS